MASFVLFGCYALTVTSFIFTLMPMDSIERERRGLLSDITKFTPKHANPLPAGASKFAPHLEKCLGMGRTSSRLAHKKTPVSVESEEEHSEDNEEDWTYPEKKCKLFS